MENKHFNNSKHFKKYMSVCFFFWSNDIGTRPLRVALSCPLLHNGSFSEL